MQIFIYLLQGQLWKLTNDKKLENKNGKWKYSDRKWTIPDEGKVGHIQDETSGKVLALAFRTNVDLEDKGDIFEDIKRYS